MFYCDPCAVRRGWPQTIFRSDGHCECCGHARECSDLPSKYLPLPPREVREGQLFTYVNYPDGHLRIIRLVRSGRVYHADALVPGARWDRYFNIAQVDWRVTAWVAASGAEAPKEQP
jgi:hypothetical protein